MRQRHLDLAFRKRGGFSPDIVRFDTGDAPIDVRVGGRFRANSGHALRMAALRDLGIVMQRRVLLADDLAQGRLVPLLPNERPQSRPLQLVTHLDRHRLPKLRSFIDITVAMFAERLRPRAAGRT